MRVTYDSDIGSHVDVHHAGVDVDTDDLAARRHGSEEGVGRRHLAADHEQDIRGVHGFEDRARTHARADAEGVVSRDDAGAVDRGDHRRPEELGQCDDVGRGVARSATRDDEHSLGLDQGVSGSSHRACIRGRHRQRVGHSDSDIATLLEQIERDLDVHRPWPTCRHPNPRIAHGVGEVLVRLRSQARISHEIHDSLLILGLVQEARARPSGREVARHSRGDKQDRRRVRIGLRHRRRGVVDRGAARHDRDARAPARARVAVRGVPAALLVGGRDDAHAVAL